jgi:hypothetical protein
MKMRSIKQRNKENLRMSKLYAKNKLEELTSPMLCLSTGVSNTTTDTVTVGFNFKEENHPHRILQIKKRTRRTTAIYK